MTDPTPTTTKVHRCPHCPFVHESLVQLALHLRDEHLVPRLNAESKR